MSVFYIIHQAELIRLEVDTAVGSGGEGTVYPIISPKAWQGFCVKEYAQKYRTCDKQAKLQFMIEHPPAQLSNAHSQLCWPVAIAYDAGFTDFVGFVMPLAYADSQELYLLSNLTNKRLGQQWQAYFDRSPASFDKRLTVAVNLCIAVALIYQNDNYAIVDFKPQNIMFTSDGKVALVDLDSIQIAADQQGQPHYGRVNTVEYTPPEGRDIVVKETLVDKTWDEFSLAVILYQILLGIHPYMASYKTPYDGLNSLGDKIQQNLFVHDKGKPYLSTLPPLHKRFESLPYDIQRLFKVSFDNDTKRRTSARLWQQALSQYLTKQGFQSKPALPTILLKTQMAQARKSLSTVTTPVGATIYKQISRLLALVSSAIKSLNHYSSRLKSSTLTSTAKPAKTVSQPALTRQNSLPKPNKTSNYQKRSYINDKPPVHKSVRPAKTLLNFNQFNPNPHQQRPLPKTKPKKAKPSLSTRIAQSSIVKFLDDPMAMFCFMFFIVGLVMLLDAVISDNPSTKRAVANQTISTPAEPTIVESSPVKESTDNSIFDTDMAGKAIDKPDANALIKAGIIPLPGPPLPDKIQATLSADKRYDVLIKVTTDASGNINQAEMLMPSYHALLDTYTLSTFQNMTFESQSFEKRPIEKKMIFLIYY